jgi:SAM-dependent methyltransferase
MIPFSAHCTASDPAVNNQHRLRLYRKFMGVGTLAHVNSLDVGPPNYIGQELRVRDFTVGDFNRWVIGENPPYDVITAFEVINHTLNPLNFMEGIYNLLRDGGSVYLATPKQWLIPWYHGTNNFVEYKREKLEALFQYVGFEVVKYEVKNPWPFRFIFYGLRPPLRYLFNRYQIWELKKNGK